MSDDVRDVELHIGEIAVHGVEVERPDLLGPAFEAAFSRLLHERGVPASWSTGELTAPDRTLTMDRFGPTTSTEALAERLARTVYEGLR
ncbi:hypothetical protein J1792_17390 [Streptomyces triculaminicus]|uniref:Uncharacterized protein n=2 Tax=Streptomyces TaxID=1883 RepID=A0A939JMR5_9ACTN|nr:MULTISPECIES: hypothetical protein [Streptomyces]MBO0654491.1 hypothetical protein [Streptomyces triculaminicus]QSY49104.1 hypothetical protein J3S04_29665 [Streptomyces griseocarneus]